MTSLAALQPAESWGAIARKLAMQLEWHFCCSKLMVIRQKSGAVHLNVQQEQ
jgi:hypothetical protein